jgi:hypothetical protein
MEIFLGPSKRNENHKNIDTERFLKQIVPYAVFVKNTIFANFNRLPKIYDNLDRPKSFRFVFRAISTSF